MLEVLRQGLAVLAEQESIRAPETYKLKLLVCRERILERFDRIPSTAIPALMHEPYGLRGDIVGEGNRWIFLPAVSKGGLCIPILNVIWDLRDSGSPAISFQTALFSPNGDDDPLASVWRFESPEGPGESRHGYYHAQPSRGLRTLARDVDVDLADKNVRDGQPTIPVAAGNPVELLLCMLLSIYGAFEARELVEASGDLALSDPLHELLGR